MNDSEVRIGTELDTSQAEKQSEKLGKSLAKNIGGGAKTAIKGVAAIGTTMVAAGGVAVGSLVKMAKATAETGDHIDKMSQKIGMSAEAYQKWDYVARISGTSIDGLKMGFKTLTNTIDKANKGNAEAVDKFKQVGVSMDDLKNKSREQIFEDTIKGLQNMKDETERSALANKLLGRAGMELGPMLNSTNADLDKLMKTAEDYGMIMSDKAVKASAQFQDSVTTMQMTMQGMKNRMMAEFLPALTQVTDGLALVFKGDVGEGSKKMEEGIQGLVDKITEALPKLLKVGGSIIKGIAQSIINNLPQIVDMGVTIFQNLIQGLTEAIPQIVSMLPTILKSILDGIIQILPTITSFIPSLVTSLIEMLKEAVPILIEQLPTILTQLINGLFDALESFYDNAPQLIEMGVNFVLGLANAILEAIPLLIERLPTLIQKMVDYVVSSLPIIINGIIQLVVGIVKALPKIIVALVKAIPKIIKSVIKGLIEALPQLIQGCITLVIELVKNLPTIIIELIKAIPTIIADLIKAFIEGVPQMVEGLIKFVKNVVTNGPKIVASLFKKIPTLIIKIVKKFGKMGEEMLTVGKDIVTGIWKGIKNAGKWLWDKIGGFCDDIVDGFCGFLGIGSPSKVMRDEVGYWMGEGIYEGFKKSDPMAQIKKDFATGVGTLQNSINMQWSASSIGNAVSNAIDGLTVSVDGRTFGRIVRSY